MTANPKPGKFLVSPNRFVFGDLFIAGRDSSVILRADEPIPVEAGQHVCIRGTLHDHTKITLIDCLRTGTTSHGVAEARSHSIVLFPHFIAEGRHHFDPDQVTIHAVSFTFEDAARLFYDFEAFGNLIDPTPFIDDILKAATRGTDRQIRRGPNPQIAYFSGQRTIVEVDTAIGSVTAQHCPSFSTGGARGVRIDNQIWMSIIPSSPITLDDAVDRVMALLRFITVAVGRHQDVPRLAVDLGSKDEPRELTVHWSHSPRRSSEWSSEKRAPHPGDLPFDPIDRGDEFSRVMRQWLDVDKDRRTARIRIHESLAGENYYTVDRLVGAANAFDLLPETAVPKCVELSHELMKTKEQCMDICRALSPSDERQTLLNAFGRLGRASLKQKIRHRVRLVSSVAETRFPELDWVCDKAVDCRNHFVHGSGISFDVDGAGSSLSFLTDTLEFVFMASEFIEFGWDIRRFLETPTSMSHPFGEYRITYKEGLDRLCANVRKQRSSGNACSL